MDGVLERWTQLIAWHPMVQRYLANPEMSSAELDRVNAFVEIYRERPFPCLVTSYCCVSRNTV